MLLFMPIDINTYEQPKTEIVYYHNAKPRVLHGSSSSESDSEGMHNDSTSCWMISVIQALRGSDAFRKEYAPKSSDKNALKTELFKMFDISEGNNGESRRRVPRKAVRNYKRLAIDSGLKAKMDRGYLEEPFLRFLLKKIDAKPIEYFVGKTPKKETMLRIHLKATETLKELQDHFTQEKISFGSKAPRFLPITISGRSKAKIAPSSTLKIAKKGGKATYKLVSIVIGRDSIQHAYSYVLEKAAKGKTIWVEYNDDKVAIHKDPKAKLRRKTSKRTPFDDACKNAEILIYDRQG